MIASPGRVVSVLVGGIAPLGSKAVPTGFVKRAVDGPVAATAAGLAGDEQADRRVHGAPDKAIYGYSAAAYDFWRTAFPHHSFAPGAMGENLTLDGCDETNVAIGDRVRIGSALLQVTEPRQPCFKLALAFDDSTMPRALTRSGRCGWYYRTLEPGMIAAGDTSVTIDRPNPEWPVARFFEVISARAFGRNILAEIAAIEGVSDGWRVKALRALSRSRGDG